MERAEFWRLIEAAKAESDGECEGQMEILQARLEALPPEEIVAFDNIVSELRGEAYRWDLWGAAFLINGGCSDDGFEYFRCWLIAQGEKVYTDALRDPDTLADVVDPERDDYDCEALLYVAGYAYEAKTGQEIPGLIGKYPEIIGEQWEEDELDAMFPRLSALYN